MNKPDHVLVRQKTKAETGKELLSQLKDIERKIAIRQREHAWEMGRLYKERKELADKISEALNRCRKAPGALK